MASCMECIHFNPCNSHNKIIVEKPTEGNDWILHNKVENECKYFKPTADVVEVVRCEKCVWALEPIQEKTIGEELETYHFCKIHNKYFTPDNYCSCGERRKE